MVKRQRDFNADMGAYLDRRKGSSTNSGSFSFLSVDNLFSKKSSGRNAVPDVHAVETTIVEEERVPRKGFFSFLFGSRSKQTLDEDDFPEDVREEVEEVEHSIEEIDHEVEELEEKRAGLFTRLFSMIRGRSRQVDEDEDGDIDPEVVASTIGDHARNEALISDTRVVLKDLHKWLGRLPPEQVEAFKRSPDFQRYKDILEAYGLIR